MKNRENPNLSSIKKIYKRKLSINTTKKCSLTIIMNKHKTHGTVPYKSYNNISGSKLYFSHRFRSNDSSKALLYNLSQNIVNTPGSCLPSSIQHGNKICRIALQSIYIWKRSNCDEQTHYEENSHKEKQIEILD